MPGEEKTPAAAAVVSPENHVLNVDDAAGMQNGTGAGHQPPPDAQGQEEGAPATSTSPEVTADLVGGHHVDGHESSDLGGGSAPFFVAPSSYLRPVSSRGHGHGAAGSASNSGIGTGVAQSGARGGMREKPMTPVDREQIEGLVSSTSHYTQT